MRPRVSVSPWAALAGGMIVYCSEGKTLLLVLLAVTAHEAGHLLALRLLGCRVTELRAELSGFCIRYAGSPGRWGEVIAAVSGPLAGLLYALPAARCGAGGELSAGFSLLFSIFNLIPALPLDGGRAAAALFGERVARILSLISALAVCFIGLALFHRGFGAALALAGFYLLAFQLSIYGSSSPISPD